MYTISDVLVPKDQWQVKPGDQFHNLTVIGEPFYMEDPKYSRRQYVRVRCVCGLEKNITCRNLGRTKSCGKSCKESPDNHGLKKCTSCKRFLPKEAFGNNRAKKDGLATECYRCNISVNLLRCYGMTLEEYEERLIKQEGVCAICKLPDGSIKNDKWQPLYVDHNHVTGSIRGLLCHNCNVSLGLFNDDVSLLKNAIVYLEGSGG